LNNNNLNSVLNQDIMLKFVEWGFDQKMIELLNTNKDDINQRNILSILNIMDRFINSSYSISEEMSNKNL